jgi:ABC-2 type transport system permease protein
MLREIKFLLALWKANLISAMEYRTAFLTQAFGMFLNNAAYFVFWVIFFNRFKEVRGWVLIDMVFLFGVVATAFGLSVYLFGNITTIADIIANGRLDYYLALPRPVLIHVLASRSIASGFGDFLYGLTSFAIARQFTLPTIGRFILAVSLSVTIFLSFLVIVQSLTFWFGNTSMLTFQVTNAIITFSIYPTTLFDGTAKFLLLTIIPAGFVGAIPAEFIRAFTWTQLFQMLGAATIFFSLSMLLFHKGLSRYESGSAIQIQI